jgi:hypothetical protein
MALDTSILALGTGAATFTAAETALSVPSDDLLAMAKQILDAVMAGQGWLGAALVLIALTGVARKFGKAYLPFLATDVGGMVLAAVGSFGGALATAFAAGASVSGTLMLTAFGVAVAAMGGYVGLAKGLLPFLEKAAVKWSLLKGPVALLRWFLDRPSTVKKAEAAGAQAVEASPGKGLEALGPEDVVK